MAHLRPDQIKKDGVTLSSEMFRYTKYLLSQRPDLSGAVQIQQEIADIEKYVEGLRKRAVLGARLYDRVVNTEHNSIRGWSQLENVIEWYEKEMGNEPPLDGPADPPVIYDGETKNEARIRLAGETD